ncbi:MAG: M48 family metallopeptidase, partial [Erysipelotrichia bacterium]|nr:M48 family metallopeptidase [Erysipelotrichia bacterium]
MIKFAPRLLKATTKPSPYFDNNVYLFGHVYSLEKGQITFPNNITIDFENRIDFEKKLKKFFLKFVTELVRINEAKMNIPPNNVRVRKMKTRYGSNSKKTKTICLNLELVHYELEIINAIVI